MKIILDIKDEHDLAILLPLLERLKISFAYPKSGNESTPAQVEEEVLPVKNFDLEKLDNLFNQLREMNAFAQIEDPVSWQKQQRDEWN